jgi:hypothetical protein
LEVTGIIIGPFDASCGERLIRSEIAWNKIRTSSAIGQGVLRVQAMQNQENPAPSNLKPIERRKKPLVSRTRLVMGLLLIVAIPIFIALANKAVHENADAIRQSFGQ